MLLQSRLHDPRALIAAGTSSLAIALAAQRFLHPPTDFWQGFVAGLTGVLVGLSIVLNLRGLALRRQSRRQ
ncbi:MAG: hypothetical protein MUE90_14665 [Thermoanaerobaculales bacterium]|jgi:hypothetical protein|nr:hypothetical protein [Thermoanaerobaculales bacterium]